MPRTIYKDESGIQVEPNYVLVPEGTIASDGNTVDLAGAKSDAEWGRISGTLSNQTDLQSALDAKAPLASPTFTGTPAAPTAAIGTNTTQLATTAFIATSAECILSSTQVNTNVGTKQALYTVPNGKSCVITKLIVRSASASLGAVGDGVSFGFNGDATDFLTVSSTVLAALTDATIIAGASRFDVAGRNWFLGAATNVFGCIFIDPSITATVQIDVFGYLF